MKFPHSLWFRTKHEVRPTESYHFSHPKLANQELKSNNKILEGLFLDLTFWELFFFYQRLKGGGALAGTWQSTGLEEGVGV